MAAYVKYQLGVEKLAEGGNCQTDTWQIILSNTAPNVATDTTAASATKGSSSASRPLNLNKPQRFRTKHKTYRRSYRTLLAVLRLLPMLLNRR